MEANFIKRIGDKTQVNFNDITLRQLINFLESKKLEDGIKIRYINNLLVLSYK